jgi:hypothetical protein
MAPSGKSIAFWKVILIGSPPVDLASASALRPFCFCG